MYQIEIFHYINPRQKINILHSAMLYFARKGFAYMFLSPQKPLKRFWYADKIIFTCDGYIWSDLLPIMAEDKIKHEGNLCGQC